MGRSVILSNIWLKAAVAGSIWASSEIVLGSFLHNLRIPFSSIILTGIAIVLLVSLSYRWKDKGLIWRAGLICAIMKSVSPSAIIFGPMIAIVVESFLLELSVLILGKNMIGFLTGGMLAMSWNLFQKIANMLIFYGFNIVDLYTSLVEYASRQLHISALNAWSPVFALLAFYMIFGALSASLGIAIGKASPGIDKKGFKVPGRRSEEKKPEKTGMPFNYSFSWLGFTIAGMLAVLFLMNYAAATWWLITGIALLAVWVFRYHGILRPLKKPKFWIIFVLITMLSSLILVKVQPSGLTLADGIMVGLEMNFRAAILMVGFSIIGKETSNPVIRSFFLRTSFRQLPMALEVAFDTLPFALASMPPFFEIFKSPLRTMQQFGAQAEIWLERVETNFQKAKKVIIITGAQGAGKTTMLARLATRFSSAGIPVCGIIAPATYQNDIRTGYNIVDVATNESMRLSQTNPEQGKNHIGHYCFSDEAVRFGKKILRAGNIRSSKLVFIDEIGPWEIEGNGWAEDLGDLLNDNIPLILAVRECLVEKVIGHWQIDHPLIIDVNLNSDEGAFTKISGIL